MTHESAKKSFVLAGEFMIQSTKIDHLSIHYLLVLVARHHLDDAAALVHHRHFGPAVEMCPIHDSVIRINWQI